MLAQLSAIHDKLKGFRTLLFGAVLGTIDVLQVTDIAPIIPATWQPYWMALHPFLFMYLRLITKGPVGAAA